MLKLRISTKILISFSIVAATTLGLVGLLSYTIGVNTLEQEAFNKLTAIREMKASQIEDYFNLIADQIITLSNDQMIIDAMKGFDEAHETISSDLDISDNLLELWQESLRNYYQDEFFTRLNPNLYENVSMDDYFPHDKETIILQSLYISKNPYLTGEKDSLTRSGDGSLYADVHQQFHPAIRDYLDRFGYYDIFLVDINSGGHIVYSVYKEVDFGTSLIAGPYSSSNIGKAYRAALEADEKDFILLVDYEPYYPSYSAPAAFIASPIYDGFSKIGVLIFQMPIDRINNIMTNHQKWEDVGLGKSGETYLVGEDYLLRNQSRFLIESSEEYFQLIEEIGTPEQNINLIRNLNSTIGLQLVETEGTKAALNGQTGTSIFPDYRGVPVFSAYKPLNIDGVNWVLMSEKDEAEVFLPIQELQRSLGFGMLGLFAVIVLIGILFSRTLTKPISALSESAKELSKGNLENEVECSSKDEIGDLAQSFEVMRQELKRSINDLEEIILDLEGLVTERTQELELSEKKSTSIIETAADGIIVIDNNSNVILWNQSAEKMFGYSKDEIEGKSLKPILPQRFLPRHDSAMNKANESGQLAHPDTTHELFGTRKDGTEFPLELTISQWAIAGEIYYSGILRDVTERKEMEYKILQQKEMLETTIESLAHPFYVIDVEDYSLKLANSAALELGISGESKCYALTHRRDTPCDSLEDPCPLVQVKKTKEPFTVEHIHFDKDGDPRYVEVRGYPIFDSDGNVVQMIEYSLDITERKEVEKQLRFLSEALQSAADGVAIIDLENKVQWINPAFTKITGYPEDEIVGKLITILNSGHHPEEFYQQIGKSLDSGEIWRGEITQKRKDGSLYPEALSVTPIFNEEDEIEHFVSIRQDITERKALERQLELANERMLEELNFAREIQMSMLPLIFPAFPTRSEFNIYAHLIPAREVGGDFYDFYFLDEDHLCFVVGDVSGKGAPGALLMAVSKTLIKSRALDDFQPSSILTHVNNEVSQNNDSAMFVTVFLGVLDIQTGRITYCNAGHNPPYILRNDKSIEKLDDFHGPVIGALPNLSYKESFTNLKANDIIALHTDGVTEAMNPEEKLFTDDRYEKFLESENLNTPQKIIDQAIREVKKFENGAIQADDITMLSLQYIGASDMKETGRLEITIPNQLSSLEVVEDNFEKFSKENNIPDTARQKVSIVIDELLNNIVSYAFRDNEEHIIDLLFVLTGNRLVITIHDDGVPFNPFELDPPDISLSLDERSVGGLGIMLVRQMMDEYMYSRHIGKNVVRLVKLTDKE